MKNNKKTSEKLEAIIRYDIENMPYKFRDLHYMLYEGIKPYKNMDKVEIDETFEELELTITKEDKEWAQRVGLEELD